MNIDWDAILKAGLDAAQQAAAKQAPQVEDYLREIAQGHRGAIEAIGAAFARGDIDEDTFKSEMDDEATVLAAELRVAAVMGKAIAQRAVNAFRDAVVDALVTAARTAI